MPRGEALPSEIQIVTVKTRDAAIELLGRLFREEEFATTPLSRIAENFDRILADPLCWSALASDGEAAQCGGSSAGRAVCRDQLVERSWEVPANTRSSNPRGKV
jgi:hypothetical protein